MYFSWATLRARIRTLLILIIASEDLQKRSHTIVWHDVDRSGSGMCVSTPPRTTGVTTKMKSHRSQLRRHRRTLIWLGPLNKQCRITTIGRLMRISLHQSVCFSLMCLPFDGFCWWLVPLASIPNRLIMAVLLDSWDSILTRFCPPTKLKTDFFPLR